MRKIPTLFRRDPEDMRRLLREVHPDCQWVLDGDGTPTRKYDGVSVMFDGEWWARREVKPGKAAPTNYRAVGTDPDTGKTVGWEPAEQSAWFKYLREAIASLSVNEPYGTYELCGPKVNRNPEDFTKHVLIKHKLADIVDAPRDFDGLQEWLPDFKGEGIVWHHPDGRMAKIKRRDFQ